jgi:hypothetical protein
MNTNRYALGVIAALVFPGCGGLQVAPTGGAPSGAPDSFPYHRTFNYTGGGQTFKVPAGARQLKVIALGAHGAGFPKVRGGRVSAVIPVTPGEVLAVFVGGDASRASGGFNGGADGGEGYEDGHAGFGAGGASDAREHGVSLGDRIVVVGGGGGQGGGQGRSAKGGAGGKGGDETGGAGGTGGNCCSSFGFSGGGGGNGGTQYSGGLAVSQATATVATLAARTGGSAAAASAAGAISTIPRAVVAVAAATTGAAGAAEARRLKPTALPPEAEAAVAHRMSSLAPPTYICGKDGKSRRVMA